MGCVIMNINESSYASPFVQRLFWWLERFFPGKRRPPFLLIRLTSPLWSHFFYVPGLFSPKQCEKSELYLWPDVLRGYFMGYALVLALPLIIAGSLWAGGFLAIVTLFSPYLLYFLCRIPVLQGYRGLLPTDEQKRFDRCIAKDGCGPSWRAFLMRWGIYLPLYAPNVCVSNHPLWMCSSSLTVHEWILRAGIADFFQAAQGRGFRRFLLFWLAPLWVSYMGLMSLWIPWFFQEGSEKYFTFSPTLMVLEILLWVVVSLWFLERQWRAVAHWFDLENRHRSLLAIPPQLHGLTNKIFRHSEQIVAWRLHRLVGMIPMAGLGIYLVVWNSLWLLNPDPPENPDKSTQFQEAQIAWKSLSAAGDRLNRAGETLNNSSEKLANVGNRLDAGGNTLLQAGNRLLTVEDELLEGMTILLEASRGLDYAGISLGKAGQQLAQAGRDLDQAGTKLDTAGTKLDTAGTKLDTAGKGLDRAGDKIAQAGDSLTRVGHWLTTSGKAVVGAWEKVGEAWRRVAEAWSGLANK